MIATLQPGQKIRCTLVKTPRAAAGQKTVLRLMRRDPDVVRGLRKSHHVRQRTTVVYYRGNRDWVQRQKCAQIVTLTRGKSWTFTYDLSIANDMASVAEFLKIEAA